MLNTHCIANFRIRAGMTSIVAAVDEMRRLFDKTQFSGTQEEPKGRTPGKRLRAPRKPRLVTVWDTIEDTKHWVFFVRGRVLLTVHLHEVKRRDETLL